MAKALNGGTRAVDRLRRVACVTLVTATMNLFNFIMIWSLISVILCWGCMLAREGLKHG